MVATAPVSRRRLLLTSALGLAGIAAVPLLAACGGAAPVATPAPAAPAAAAQPPAPAAPTATPQAAAAPAAAGAIELRIHDWLQDPQDTFYGPLWKDFEAKHPGVTIKREWF